MTALLRAEARRTLATRVAVVLAGLVVLYPVVSAIFVSVAPDVDRSSLSPDDLHGLVRGIGDLGVVVAAVIGIVMVAGEYRHRSITSTLLVAPDRRRLLVAQLGVLAALGAAAAALACIVGLAAGGAVLAANGVSVELADADLARIVLAVVLVTATYAVIGGAIGAIVAEPTAAVTGILVWMMAIEEVVPIVIGAPALHRWLPGGASDGLLHIGSDLPGALSPGTAIVLLSGVVAALVIVAGHVSSRREIR